MQRVSAALTKRGIENELIENGNGFKLSASIEQLQELAQEMKTDVGKSVSWAVIRLAKKQRLPKSLMPTVQYANFEVKVGSDGKTRIITPKDMHLLIIPARWHGRTEV